MMPTVALLAGGLATRLYPITQKIPKALLEVNGRPFIHHQLSLLKSQGITSVVICAGYLGEQIEGYVGDGAQYGLSVRYSYDGEKLLGTGGALRQAAPLLGSNFWVLYGDSYLELDLHAILSDFSSRGVTADKLGLMTVLKNDGMYDKSNAAFQQGLVVKYDKAQSDSEMCYIDYGLSLLKQEIFTLVPEQNRFDLSNLLKALAEQKRLLGFEVNKRFYEIGSSQGLEDMRSYLRNKEGEKDRV